MTQIAGEVSTFHLLETTIDDIERAYTTGDLSARELTQLYLNRIDAILHRRGALNHTIVIGHVDRSSKCTGFTCTQQYSSRLLARQSALAC